VFDEAPLLPMGYVGMTDLVMGQNRDFQRLAAEELGRRRLGPFAPAETTPVGPALPPVSVEDARARLVEAQAAERSRRRSSSMVRAWLGLPLALRLVAAASAVVALTALGVHWETAGSQMGLPARLLLHTWLLGTIVLVFAGARRLRERWDHESFALGCAFAALAAVGVLTDRVVALL
jgi:hypothetical protein